MTNKWDVASSSSGTIKIQKNKAVKKGDNGGTGGAIYLENAHYVMESGTIGGSAANRNEAANYGGGIYLTGSEFIFKAGEVSYNSAVASGGGILLTGTSSATFTGGDITYNSSGSLGGGVTLNSGSSFTMTGGIISGNKAICEVSGAATTTYNARNDGFGGGFFIFNTDESTPASSLVINIGVGTPFGLYGNEASIGGNDITASGVRTSVKLPNVKSMELAGFEYKDASPNWYEDYNAADENYSQGTNLHAATKARYADQLTANTYLRHLVSFEGNSHTYMNYLNLTLGYELLRIVISVKNLAAGESALFRLIFAQGTANEKSWPILLTGNESSIVSKTIRNLNYGQYKAEPVNWQWNYEVSPSTGYSENITAGPEKKYEFTLTPKGPAALKTDEAQIVNKMGLSD